MAPLTKVIHLPLLCTVMNLSTHEQLDIECEINFCDAKQQDK